MNKFLIFRIFHFVYLGLLLTFILFYFTVYQPIKLHSLCAETSAKTVLGSTSNVDAYDFYQRLHKDCIAKK